MNWTKIWKSCGYQLMGFQTLHWRRFYLWSLCFISSKIDAVFRFSWKWPAMRMTARLSAQCRPLVTEVCPAECGQPPACSGDNQRQEMSPTAVMSQVRLKYFTKEIYCTFGWNEEFYCHSVLVIKVWHHLVMLGYSILGLKNMNNSGKQYACKLITKFLTSFSFSQSIKEIIKAFYLFPRIFFLKLDMTIC